MSFYLVAPSPRALLASFSALHSAARPRITSPWLVPRGACLFTRAKRSATKAAKAFVGVGATSFCWCRGPLPSAAPAPAFEPAARGLPSGPSLPS